MPLLLSKVFRVQPEHKVLMVLKALLVLVHRVQQVLKVLMELRVQLEHKVLMELREPLVL